MQDFSLNPMAQYYPAMGFDEYNRMFTEAEERLERMYPRIYFIVNPVVIRQCDLMEDTFGPDYIPTNEELERYIDNIVMDVEGRLPTEMPEVNPKHHQSEGNPRGNPHGNPDGRPFLRGLVGTLLISELLGRRRRRPFRRFPGFFPGPFPGFFPWFFPGFF